MIIIDLLETEIILPHNMLEQNNYRKFYSLRCRGPDVVTCTAFPHVTLHRQPFPFTRLDAALCITRVTCPA